jgi:hypothetical protein
LIEAERAPGYPDAIASHAQQLTLDLERFHYTSGDDAQGAVDD